MSKVVKPNSGYTFIEVLIAVTILSIIILTLYSVLDIGLVFRKRIDKTNWSYTQLQQAIAKISKDFRTIFFRSSSTRYSFKGNMYQVSFFIKNFTSGKVEEVQYEYSPADTTLFFQKGAKRITIFTDLKQCNFSYYHPEYKYWDNYWDALEKQQLPQVVRIEFIYTYSEEKFTFDFPIYIEEKGIKGK